MPGNINGIMWGDNISFSLTKPSTGDITLDGQLIIGSTGNNPQAGFLTSTDASVTITNGAGTIDLAAKGGGIFAWEEVTTATKSAAVNMGYITNRGGGVAYTLPAAASVGDVIRIAGYTGAWTLAQNAGQTIHFGNQDTTTGVGGSLASTDAGDSVEMVCVVTNNDFAIISSIGNITVA